MAGLRYSEKPPTQRGWYWVKVDSPFLSTAFARPTYWGPDEEYPKAWLWWPAMLVPPVNSEPNER